MGGIKELFKKKPGGTFLGNALRGVVKAAAGAIPVVGGTVAQMVGNGVMTQEEYDLKNLSDSDYQSKYGITKTGAKAPQVSEIQPQIQTIEQRIEELKKAAQPSFLGIIKQKYLLPAIAALVGLVALVFVINKKRK